MAYTIIEVERKTGIASRKIRFWADKGLFPFVECDEFGVRYFSERDIGWVEWVNCLRNCNMSIADIKHYIALTSKGMESANERRELLKNQANILRNQLKTLKNAQKKIDAKIAMYDEMIASGIDFLNPNAKAYKKP